VLGVLGRIVDYDLAAVCMLDDGVTYLTVARESSQMQYTEFFGAVADAASQVTGTTVDVRDLVPRVADPRGLLGQDDEGRMATFLSMPLRAAGRVVGAIAMSSATKNAFGEASLNTLRLIEGPAAVVVNNARLAGREQHA
jgi:transcriptional regulator with GAF, ATPase, and Fis domain